MTIPVEKETRILSRSDLNIDGIKTVLEKWSWDGLIGNSVIFTLNDLPDNYDAAEVIIKITDELNLPSETKFTVKDAPDYLFINYFITEEVDDDLGWSFPRSFPELSPEEAKLRKELMADYIRIKNLGVVDKVKNSKG